MDGEKFSVEAGKPILCKGKQKPFSAVRVYTQILLLKIDVHNM